MKIPKPIMPGLRFNPAAKASLLIALALTVACGGSTEPESVPKWADNTNWRGSFTMKSGTTLNVSFHLKATFGPVGGFSQQNAWIVTVDDPRIENPLSGKFIDQANVAADPRSKWVHLEMSPDLGFDGPLPVCSSGAPSYEIDLNLADSETLAGTVTLSCHFPEKVMDGPQPITMRKI